MANNIYNLGEPLQLRQEGGLYMYTHTHTHTHTTQLRQEGGGYMYTHTTQLRQEGGGYIVHTHHTTQRFSRRSPNSPLATVNVIWLQSALRSSQIWRARGAMLRMRTAHAQTTCPRSIARQRYAASSTCTMPVADRHRGLLRSIGDFYPPGRASTRVFS